MHLCLLYVFLRAVSLQTIGRETICQETIYLDKGYLYLIKRLCTVAVGPPKLRFFHHQFKICSIFIRIYESASLKLLSLRGCQDRLYGHLLFLQAAACYDFSQRLNARQTIAICLQHSGDLSCSCSLYLGMHLQLHCADLIAMYIMTCHLMLLCHIDLLNPGLIKRQHINIPKKSCIGQTRTPVPSEHACSLAQLREASHALCGSFRRMSLVSRLYEFRRRMEKEAQIIVRCCQLCHIKFPGAVHVVHTGDFFSV